MPCIYSESSPSSSTTLELAIDSITKALRCKPDFAEAICNLGNAMLKKARKAGGSRSPLSKGSSD